MSFFSTSDTARQILLNMGQRTLCLLNSAGIRNRHIITRQKKLRLRYYMPVVSALVLTLPFSIQHLTTVNSAQASIAMASAVQTAPPQKVKNLKPSSGLALRQTYTPPTQAANNDTERTDDKNAEVTLASFYKTAPPVDNPVNIKIQAGQTVTGQLTEIGISSTEAYHVVEALGEYFDPRKIRPGQSFEVEYDEQDGHDAPLKSVSKMTMPLSPAKEIVVYKQNETFKAKEIEKKLTTTVAANKATIKYSLYGSAAKAGIPDDVIANMIKIFSWSVDFQRDIRSGDEIEIMYEAKATDDGTLIGYGDILYARLVTGGQDLSLYRHKMKDGHVDYFDPKGHSIKRTLMKTPIDGARMSSGFGMRRHPVLGYNKMHKGVDFAAPRGTPIYAAGDGVIEKAGRNGSYGNYVRIRHNSKLKTAYAHMKSVKSGVRSGTRVKQGQVIGYVGTTGRSTGPHLHYEVLINGRQVNPRGVNVPTGETLAGQELNKFKANKVRFDGKFAALLRGEKYAQASATKTTYNR